MELHPENIIPAESVAHDFDPETTKPIKLAKTIYSGYEQAQAFGFTNIEISKVLATATQNDINYFLVLGNIGLLEKTEQTPMVNWAQIALQALQIKLENNKNLLPAELEQLVKEFLQTTFEKLPNVLYNQLMRNPEYGEWLNTLLEMLPETIRKDKSVFSDALLVNAMCKTTMISNMPQVPYFATTLAMRGIDPLATGLNTLITGLNYFNDPDVNAFSCNYGSAVCDYIEFLLNQEGALDSPSVAKLLDVVLPKLESKIELLTYDLRNPTIRNPATKIIPIEHPIIIKMLGAYKQYLPKILRTRNSDEIECFLMLGGTLEDWVKFTNINLACTALCFLRDCIKYGDKFIPAYTKDALQPETVQYLTDPQSYGKFVTRIKEFYAGNNEAIQQVEKVMYNKEKYGI